MARNRRRALLEVLQDDAGGGVALVDWTNATPAAITPTDGSDVITNGDFAAWTGDDPDGWTVTESLPDAEVSEVGSGEGHGGVGTGLCNLYAATAASAAISQTPLTVDAHYRTSLDLNANPGAKGVNVTVGGNIVLANIMAVQTWMAALRAGTTAYQVSRNTTGTDTTIDNVVAIPLTDVAVAEASSITPYGWSYAHWHVTAYAAAGFDLLDSATGHYLRFYVQRRYLLSPRLHMGIYTGSWDWKTPQNVTYADASAVWAFVNPNTNTVMCGYNSPATVEGWGGVEATFDSNDLIKDAAVSGAFLDALDTLRLFSLHADNTPQAVRFTQVG